VAQLRIAHVDLLLRLNPYILLHLSTPAPWLVETYSTSLDAITFRCSNIFYLIHNIDCKWKIMGCATIAFGERYGEFNASFRSQGVRVLHILRNMKVPY